jgi:hypothetical protein
VKDVMNMSKRIGVAVVSFIFLVALVSAVPVAAEKPFSVHRWWSEVYWTGYPISDIEWTGDIWTEDGEHGTIYWDNFGFYLLGPENNPKVQKFWGVWWIDFGSDGTVDIFGYHDGSFTFAIMQCIINGHVTETSDDWSDFDGRKIHTVNFVDMASGYIEHFLQFN